jgi:hypothetical protein
MFQRPRSLERGTSTLSRLAMTAAVVLCAACGSTSTSPTSSPQTTATPNAPTATASPTAVPADDQLVGQWEIRAKLTGYVGPTVDATDNPIGLSWTSDMTFVRSCSDGTCVTVGTVPYLSVNEMTIPNSFMRHGTANMIPGLLQSGSTYTGSVSYDTPTQFTIPACSKQDVPNQIDHVTLTVTSSKPASDGSDALSLTGTEDTPVMAKCSGAVQFDVLSLTGTDIARG